MMGVMMGVERRFWQFITIRSREQRATKNPEALIFKASGTSG
jgi:hypothetical protein